MTQPSPLTGQGYRHSTAADSDGAVRSGSPNVANSRLTQNSATAGLNNLLC